MTISTGDTLPNATLLFMGDDGPASVSMADKITDRKVVIFGLPGEEADVRRGQAEAVKRRCLMDGCV